LAQSSEVIKARARDLVDVLFHGKLAVK